MATSPTQNSGYHIKSIVLVESNFKRGPEINKPNANHLPHLQLDINSSIKEDQINVMVNATLSIEGEDKDNSVSAMVAMVGTFQKYGEPVLPEDKFAEVNAPAIIYPFIREHISNLAMKSGLGQVLIPPLNFTKKGSTDIEVPAKAKKKK